MAKKKSICPMCDGSGVQVDEEKQDTVNCDACGGDGFIYEEVEDE